MSVAQSIRGAAEQLAKVSDTARLDAELLMAHALGIGRSDMLIWKMDDPAPSAFAELIARRMDNEPVAYIVGVQEFYGRDFLVTADVLIPRSDSELLIEIALEHCRPGSRVLDMGTGSGALLLTVMVEYPTLGRCYGFDNSAAALKVAKLNAQKYDLTPDTFGLFDWRDTNASLSKAFGDFDIYICNPPYVETIAKLEPQVANFEPHSALFSGEEGLDDYRIIIPELSRMSPNVAILEIGASQAEGVTAIAEGHGFVVEVRHDLANRPRAVVIRQQVKS
ncbi:peptide chain release factor N(5)-glutamine methyltransferase [Erythrobacter sp. Alg231-14]|uniref:peptide chain release factor N(5)-glutamine methyltransferase n=1 Tax=Erythrobacter sp. Alg231-14 TaxID=1922225 RepID=UPI000D54F533